MVQAYTAGAADLVIGSRAEEFAQMQGLRRFFNGIGVGWVNKVKGYRITDSQSGFRLIRSAALEKIRLTADGYREIFLGPAWAENKLAVLNGIDRELEARDSWQGKKYGGTA